MELLRLQVASHRRPGHRLGQLNLALRLHPSRCYEPGCWHAYLMGLQLCTDRVCHYCGRPVTGAGSWQSAGPDAPAQPACFITQPQVLLATCRQDALLPAAGAQLRRPASDLQGSDRREGRHLQTQELHRRALRQGGPGLGAGSGSAQAGAPGAWLGPRPGHLRGWASWGPGSEGLGGHAPPAHVSRVQGFCWMGRPAGDAGLKPG